MKLIFLLAFLVVAAQALPQSSDEEIIVASSQNRNMLQNFFRGIGINLLDVLRQRLEQANDNILDEADDNEDYDIAGAEIVSLDDIFEYGIENSLQKICQVRTSVSLIINQSKDDLQRREWISIGDRLDKVADAAQDLQSVDEAIREFWGVNIENEANDLVDQWNDWAGDLYERSNGDKVVRDNLNDFVTANTNYLNDCVDSYKDELFSFDKKVQRSAGKYEKVLEQLLSKVQECLNSSSVTCQRSVTNLIRKFSEAPRVYKQLTIDGRELNVNYTEVPCVKQVLSDAENEKSQLENDIQEYLPIETTTASYNSIN